MGAAWRTFGLVLLECRPVVLAMFALRFVAGLAIAWRAVQFVGHPVPHPVLDVPHGVLGLLAWVCATAFVYLLNGISDVPGDRVNGSSRPLASGLLRVPVAVGWCLGFAVAAVAASVAVSPVLLLCVLGMLALGWLYSAGRRPWKERVWSASLVIAGGGVLTYGGALATAGIPILPAALPLLQVPLLLSLWMAVAGNAKDLGDLAGDAAAGRRTLPVLYGEAHASWIVAVGCLLVALAGFALAAFVSATTGAAASGSLTIWVSAVLLVASILMVVLAALSGRGGAARMYGVFMVSQVVANVVVVCS